MNHVTETKLILADGPLKQRVIELLEQNDLPTSDIDGDNILFALLDNDEVIGSGGLEYFGDCALIRSVSVRAGFRENGLGKLITEELQMVCKRRGIRDIYLMTTTAKDFFVKHGYTVIDRDEAPESIKNSSQYSFVCPSSAIVMKKTLA